MFNLLLAGALGGLVRGIVGFLKYQFTYKNVKFQPAYLAVVATLSAFVGGVITWAIASSGLKISVVEEINPAVAFIIGYAGGDFIENLYKIIIGKASIYPLTDK